MARTPEHPEKHDGHAHDHGNGHSHDDHGHSDHGSPVAGVIPEKSWQDGLLSLVAALTLVGLCWMMVSWSTVPLAPVTPEPAVHQ